MSWIMAAGLIVNAAMGVSLRWRDCFFYLKLKSIRWEVNKKYINKK